MKTTGKKINGRKVFTYVFLTIAALISLFPFYFMFVSATNTNAEILSATPKLIFGSHLVENFKNLNKKMDILRILMNSTIMTVTYTALSIILHSMAGYALAKFEFKGKGLLFSLIMVTMMIPSQVMYVPLFTLMNNIGWADTYQAVVLPGLAGAFGIFLKVVLPSQKPAIGALGIYMFMSMWNNFMWPLIILSTKSMYNFPVALAMLDGVAWRKDYGVVMLATVCAVLPIMLIFLIFQKQFVAGVMGGAVKE